jgi:hypothetical protein
MRGCDIFKIVENDNSPSLEELRIQTEKLDEMIDILREIRDALKRRP